MHSQTTKKPYYHDEHSRLCAHVVSARSPAHSCLAPLASRLSPLASRLSLLSSALTSQPSGLTALCSQPSGSALSPQLSALSSNPMDSACRLYRYISQKQPTHAHVHQGVEKPSDGQGALLLIASPKQHLRLGQSLGWIRATFGGRDLGRDRPRQSYVSAV